MPSWNRALLHAEPVAVPPSGIQKGRATRRASCAGESSDEPPYAPRSLDYRMIWRELASRPVLPGHYPGAFVDWDNSPRKSLESSLVMRNVSIEAFRDGFSKLYEKATLAGSPFIFINAGNEWAEGTYFEPDEERGTALLDVIKIRRGRGPHAPASDRIARDDAEQMKGKPRLPFLISGAGEESRTLDLNLGKVALYQLSYSRIATGAFEHRQRGRKYSGIVVARASARPRRSRVSASGCRRPAAPPALRSPRAASAGFAGSSSGSGLRHALERDLEHLVDPLDRNDLELVLDVLRDLLRGP